MRKLFAAAALCTVTLAGGAIAAQDPPSPMAGMGNAMSTRADATAAADRQFAMLDADSDGQITKAERDAARERMAANRGGPGAPPPGNGMAPPPPGGGMMRGGGMMGERMAEMADGNHDGKISHDEYRAAAMARFDRMDTNHDGTIDQAEREAMRQAMRGGPGGGQ